MEFSKAFSLAPHGVTLDNGNTVYLRRFTAADRIAFAEFVDELKKQEKSESQLDLDTDAALLVFCLCDKDGNRLCSVEDVAKLKGIDADAFTTLVNEAVQLHTKAREAVKKNLETVTA